MNRNGWTPLLGAGLLALLLLAPLPFGSVQPRATALIQVFVFAALALVSLAALLRAERLRLPLIGMGCLVLLIPAVQLIPLPAALLEVLSPTTRFLQDSLRPDHLRLLPGAISVHPAETRAALLWCACCFAVFLLSANGDRFLVGANARREGRWAGRLLLVLTGAGVFQAVYGLAEHFFGWNRIFFYVRRHPMAGAAGTFVNQNNYASYLCLVLPLSLALAIGWRSSGDDENRPAGRLTGPAALLPLLAPLLILVAIVYSRSGGGLIAAAAGLLFFAFHYLVILSRRRFGTGQFLLLALLALLLVAVIALVSTGWSHSLITDQTFGSPLTRLNTWSMSRAIARDFPLFGSGAGTYHLMMVHYWNRNPEHAHNEFVELLCDLGLAGLTASLLLLWFFWKCWARSFASVARPRLRLYALGAAAAVFSIAVHGLLDFPLRIPAIAISLAAACGPFLAFSGRIPCGRPRSVFAVHRRAREEREPGTRRNRDTSPGRSV